MKEFTAYLKVLQQSSDHFDALRSLAEKTECFNPMEEMQCKKVENENAISERLSSLLDMIDPKYAGVLDLWGNVSL